MRGFSQRMRAWMLTRTERMVDLPDCHLLSGGPSQVPRRLRQTLERSVSDVDLYCGFLVIMTTKSHLDWLLRMEH